MEYPSGKIGDFATSPFRGAFGGQSSLSPLTGEMPRKGQRGSTVGAIINRPRVAAAIFHRTSSTHEAAENQWKRTLFRK